MIGGGVRGVVLAGMLAAGAAGGQPAVPSAVPPARTPDATPGGWAAFEPIGQDMEDVNPLAVDLRLEPQVQLQYPLGFRGLWRFENDRGESYFARADGAVTAVFPRSVYLRTEKGVQTPVPPGTLFIIGEPSRATLRQLGLTPPSPRAWVRPESIDEVVERLREARRSLEGEAPPPSIWNDRGYRARRLGAIIRRAGARELFGGSPVGG